MTYIYDIYLPGSLPVFPDTFLILIKSPRDHFFFLNYLIEYLHNWRVFSGRLEAVVVFMRIMPIIEAKTVTYINYHYMAELTGYSELGFGYYFSLFCLDRSAIVFKHPLLLMSLVTYCPVQNVLRISSPCH